MFFAFTNYFFAIGHFEFILGEKYVLKRALVKIFLFLRKKLENLEKGETKNRENEERRGEMSKGKKAKQKMTKDEKI